MAYATQGTVKPYPRFNAEEDAKTLKKAMKGFGTDEASITHVVGTRSNEQRQQIKQAFRTLYGQNLIEELKSELSRNYEDLVVELFMTPDEHDAFSLKNAMAGLGTDESALIEILCSRTNAQIKAAAEQYKKLYKNDLAEDLQSESSGYFKRLLYSLSQGARSEHENLDVGKAAADARALYEAGEAKWGTDESQFNAVLATRSFPQLCLTFDEYHKISGKSMEAAIDSEMSGDLRDGFKSIVKCAYNRPAFFAECLYKSMKGLGTNDRTLIRIMVSRSEIDMVQIKQEFLRAYGKSLSGFIADDCSGDYKKLLLLLCGN